MNTRTWWDIAAGVTLVALAALFLVNPDNSAGERIVLIGVLAGIGAVYAFGARRFIAIDLADDEDPPLGLGLSLQAALLALVTVGVFVDPNMMSAQIVVMPLIWMSARSTVHAVIANICAAALFGTAYAAGGGWTSGSIGTGFTISVVSAAFSVALGLWITRIATWGVERQRLLEELTATQGELEAAHREAGAATERERLARDIHDTIAQSLTSIVMLAQRLRLEDTGSEAAQLIEETAREALVEARALVASNAAVTPSAASGSLEASLVRLGERFERETAVRVAVDAHLEVPLSRDLEVVILRCAQEGLANIRKHAGATAVSLSLATERDFAVLVIRDDGRGLGGYRLADEGGFGLVGMRDRLALVGGSLQVTDAPGGGVCLTVRVPHPSVHPQEAFQ
ncbi:sensor histidine kinase [Paramicrobacterium humi]|uniref:sensor histidine kinase n=1 Tax=Paramicrobacterium humi TaxID=640635 RepID=UPI00115FA7E7|nr:sensor histidine kinase [Microbacterium humi]